MGRCENTGMPHNNFLALSIITTSITKFIMLMDVGRAGTLHVIAVVHHTHGRSINIIPHHQQWKYWQKQPATSDDAIGSKRIQMMVMLTFLVAFEAKLNTYTGAHTTSVMQRHHFTHLT